MASETSNEKGQSDGSNGMPGMLIGRLPGLGYVFKMRETICAQIGVVPVGFLNLNRIQPNACYVSAALDCLRSSYHCYGSAVKAAVLEEKANSSHTIFLSEHTA